MALYYKMRQILLQNATAILLQNASGFLLQNATVITKCDICCKLRQHICQDLKSYISIIFIKQIRNRETGTLGTLPCCYETARFE